MAMRKAPPSRQMRRALFLLRFLQQRLRVSWIPSSPRSPPRERAVPSRTFSEASFVDWSTHHPNKIELSALVFGLAAVGKKQVLLLVGTALADIDMLRMNPQSFQNVFCCAP